MKMLARQTLTTSTVQIGPLGIGAPARIHSIQFIKSSTAGELVTVYMPFRSESASAANRIEDMYIARNGATKDYATPFEKPLDAKIMAAGSTNVVMIVWGD
jgi:hypothetical protein